MNHPIPPNILDRINRSNEILNAKTKEFEMLENDTRKLQKSIENLEDQIRSLSSETDLVLIPNKKLLAKQEKKTEKLKEIKEEAYKWCKYHEQMESQLCMLENTIKFEQGRLDAEYKQTASEQINVLTKLNELENQEERFLRIISNSQKDNYMRNPNNYNWCYNMNPTIDLMNLINNKPTPGQREFSSKLSAVRNLKAILESQIKDLERKIKES